MWVNLLSHSQNFHFDFSLTFSQCSAKIFNLFFSLSVISIIYFKILYLRIPISEAQFLSSFVFLCVCLCLCVSDSFDYKPGTAFCKLQKQFMTLHDTTFLQEGCTILPNAGVTSRLGTLSLVLENDTPKLICSLCKNMSTWLTFAFMV